MFAQGDPKLLEDPVAKELLKSTIPARLAYNWTDGTPRVVPIWFHWDGKEIVMGSPPRAEAEGAAQELSSGDHHRRRCRLALQSAIDSGHSES